MPKTRKICLILGDQLSFDIASLRQCDKNRDVVLMAEVMAEASYVPHHKKKIVFIFSAMRHFAAQLRDDGWNVDYVRLDDPENTGLFAGEIFRAARRHDCQHIVTTFPGEYRVLSDMQSWPEKYGVKLDILPDDRFMCGIEEFQKWAAGRKSLRMENFYQHMRKTRIVLMEGNQPVGGQWNYDADNRQPLPKSGVALSRPLFFPPDEITQSVIELVRRKFNDNFGDLDEFSYAVTRRDAVAAFEYFIQHRLPQFGDWQDAMQQGNPWMYHSVISLYLNAGLLTAAELIAGAESAWRTGKSPINAVEGFVRQILGWREFVRGIYWLKMPGYETLNYFNASRNLPWFYWSAETKMNCIRQCVTETRQNAYAHHIQRLMVLGNFALLAGIDPRQVQEWYLAVYADAFEWVELPNVSGMILFADGGLLASKPYAAGGAYIQKMSNYCQSCHYRVQDKNGSLACPFNYLYWDFLARHREKLQHNPRLAMVYKTYQAMSPEKKRMISDDANNFLSQLERQSQNGA